MTAEPSVAPPVAAPAPSPSGPPTRDPDEIVVAVGALLGWEGAALLRRSSDGTRVIAHRTWRPPASAAVPPVPPVPAPALDPVAWTDRRVSWSPAAGAGPDGVSCVALPVRSNGSLEAILLYFGHALREPVATELPILEAVAALLGGTDSPGEASKPAGTTSVAPGSPVERTMALVDVFAFTVRVGPDGTMDWLYFGPNSAAVFGQPVPAEESLTALIESRAHPDDRRLVGQLARAAVEGRPLDVDIRVLGGDGVLRWVSWRTAPRRSEGQLHVDGVATDVSSRHSLGRSRRELAEANEQYEREVDLRRRHALAVRDANDNVLQRLFAAGLRLQILKRRLNEVEAHAASAIAFQLDQAATDLREVIQDLNGVIGEAPEALPSGR